MQRKLICSRNIDRSGKSTASLFTATRAASTWLGFVCQFKHVLQCLLSHLIVPYMFLSIFENNFYHCLIIAVSFSSQADRSHGLCPPPCLSFSNSFWTWATKSLPEETTLSSLFILFKLPSFPWKYFGKLCLLCFPLWTSVTAVHIFTVRLSPDLLPWRCRLLVQDDSDSLTYGAWQEQNRLQVS